MTFQVGEKVVYPNHGVGTIENISTRSFGTSLERFYLLRLISNSMTVMVPFSHVGDVGLRKITRAGEIARVLTFLASGVCKFSSDWKVRFKVNSEKMRSGSLLEIAEVFKILALIQAEKPLSFREKKMLDCSRRMLIAEVSICRSIGETEAIDLLAKGLAKANVPMPPAL
jgi:CarD family transcriptional regulator